MNINLINGSIPASTSSYQPDTNISTPSTRVATATFGLLATETMYSPPHACFYCHGSSIAPTATTLAHTAGIITTLAPEAPRAVPAQIPTEIKPSNETKIAAASIKPPAVIPRTDTELAALYVTTLHKYVSKMNTVTDLRKLEPASDSINDKGVWYDVVHLKRMKEGGDVRQQDFLKKDHFSRGYTEAQGLKLRGKNKDPKKTQSYTFDLVPGTLPSQTLHDLSTGLSYLECATALQVCILQTLEELMGTDRFNIHFTRICSPTSFTAYPFIDKTIISLKKTIYKLAKEGPLQTGDFCHISNINSYQAKHPCGIGAGKNVIFDGKDKYFGFGVPKQSLEEIETLLLQLYNEDPISPAEVHSDYKKPYRPNKHKLTRSSFNLTPTAQMLVGRKTLPAGETYELDVYEPKLDKLGCRLDITSLRKLATSDKPLH